MPKKKNKIFLIGIALLALPSALFAQYATDSSGNSIPSQITEIQEQVSVSLDPQNPKPNENVKISVNAYGTDLNAATITWKVNGATVKKARGMNTFEINSGIVGKKTIINIIIEPANGPAIQKTVVIIPEELDLVWESRTYTPPFYRGKALFGPQEKVVVAAFPNFTANGAVGIAPKSLSYRWQRNFEVVEDSTGYGKDSLTFQGSILLKKEPIDVEVKGDSGADATSYIDLSPIPPQVYLYEDSPLYGVLFNKALPANDFLSGNEKTISAYPYYFGFKWKDDSDAIYQWTINNDLLSVPENQNSVIFGNPKGEAGFSVVGVNVRSKSNFLEEATQEISERFSGTSGSQANSF